MIYGMHTNSILWEHKYIHLIFILVLILFGLASEAKLRRTVIGLNRRTGTVEDNDKVSDTQILSPKVPCRCLPTTMAQTVPRATCLTNEQAYAQYEVVYEVL